MLHTRRHGCFVPRVNPLFECRIRLGGIYWQAGSQDNYRSHWVGRRFMMSSTETGSSLRLASAVHSHRPLSTKDSNCSRKSDKRKYSYLTRSTVYLRQSKDRLCYFCKFNRGRRCPRKVKLRLPTTLDSPR